MKTCVAHVVEQSCFLHKKYPRGDEPADTFMWYSVFAEFNLRLISVTPQTFYEVLGSFFSCKNELTAGLLLSQEPCCKQRVVTCLVLPQR